MGVVQRQAIKNNLLAYVGVVIGAVSQLFIYPLDLAARGYADFLHKSAMLLLPFVLLGMNSVMIRMLPYLKGGRVLASQQLFTLGLKVVTVSLSVVGLVLFFFSEQLFGVLSTHKTQVRQFSEYVWPVYSILVLLMFTSVLKSHLLNFKRIAIPVLFENILAKVSLPILIILVAYGYLSEVEFTWLFVCIFLFGLLGMSIYTWRLGILRLSSTSWEYDGKKRSDVISLALFSVFGSIGSAFTAYLDTVSVNVWLGDYDTGVYSFAIFCALVIAIPYRAITSITSPIVSEAWKKRDFISLEKLHKDASQVLFAIGCLIYVGAVLCLPYVYEATRYTGQYAVGYLAVICLGGGQVIDQLGSLNSVLINFSSYYRWSVVFVFSLGLINVVLNYLFIVDLGLGITGAALATMISLTAFNLLKSGFIYIKMGIHPFSWSILYTIVFFALWGGAVSLIPEFNSYVANIMSKGLCLIVGFYLYARYTDGVPAIKALLKSGVTSIFR